MKIKNMKPKIIAEIASSHNGNIDMAKKMIKTAADTGVDIVKFQSWQSKNVNTDDPDKKRYESLELSDEAHYVLKEECEKNGVEFLTTCYDADRIEFLKKLGLEKIKVASTDIKHINFLKQLRDNFKEVIVSSGMSTKEEIEKAVDVLESGDFTILHCVSVYPCPLEKANIKKILRLKGIAGDENVGYSDHTEGVEAAVLSMGIGVKYIEKHFTLDKNMRQEAHTTGKGLKPITTHSIASEPDTFKKLCEWRDNYEIAMGTGSLEVLPEEILVRDKYTGRLGKNN